VTVVVGEMLEVCVGAIVELAGELFAPTAATVDRAPLASTEVVDEVAVVVVVDVVDEADVVEVVADSVVDGTTKDVNTPVDAALDVGAAGGIEREVLTRTVVCVGVSDDWPMPDTAPPRTRTASPAAAKVIHRRRRTVFGKPSRRHWYSLREALTAPVALTAI
jgi:hypothetical protein